MKALWCGVLVAMSAGSMAKVVNNLAEVGGQIKTLEGQAFYAEQMGGVPRAAPFGAWPEAWGEQVQAAFLSWLAPAEPVQHLVTLGVKPWGAQGWYVGAACFAPSLKGAEDARGYGDTTCDTSYVSGAFVPNRFYVGVFAMGEEGIQPVAKVSQPLRQQHEDYEGTVRLPDAYNKLDLAPYRIRADETAIGVRAGLQTAYSGGGAYAEHLELYRLQAGQLVNVFNGLVYEFADIAGSWRPDGTREHDVSEGLWSVVMLPTQTHGFYDVQRRQGKQKITYKWSARQGRYQRQ